MPDLDLILQYVIYLTIAIFGSIGLFILLHNLFQKLETKSFKKKYKNYGKIVISNQNSDAAIKIESINNEKPTRLRKNDAKGIYAPTGTNIITCTCPKHKLTKPITVNIEPNTRYELSYDSKKETYDINPL